MVFFKLIIYHDYHGDMMCKGRIPLFALLRCDAFRCFFRAFFPVKRRNAARRKLSDEGEGEGLGETTNTGEDLPLFEQCVQEGMRYKKNTKMYSPPFSSLRIALPAMCVFVPRLNCNKK